MALELRVNNQTINNDATFEYSINLNEVNRAVVVVNGNTDFQRVLLGIGNKIEIYKNGVLDYVGVINNIENVENNGIKILSRGEEEEYIKNPVDVSVIGTNGVYIATPSATMYADFLGEGVNYSAGTIAAGVTIDFKVANSDSYFNAMLNLHSKTGQEHEVNYITKKINIVDTLGSSGVDTLNLGTDFKVMGYSKGEAPAKKVIVYGKGDGVYQIIGTATDGGYTKGIDNIKIIRDPTIISDAEAEQRADIELSKLKQSVKTYNIPITNFSKDYVIGDTITVNASTYDVVNEEVRITRVVRGRIGKNEYLQTEVTNLEHSKAYKNAAQEQSKAEYENRAKDTFMQGSGNTLTFGPAALNCTNTAPLRLNFNLPKDFIVDEADAIRVNTFTVDYDVDPFRSSVGNAELTEDGDIDGVTIDDSPPVIGETDGESLWTKITDDPTTSFSLPASSSWDTNVLSTGSFNSNNYSIIMVELTIANNGSNVGIGNTLGVRIQIGGSTQIVDYMSDAFFSVFEDAWIKNFMIRSQGGSSVDIDVDMRCSAAVDVIAGLDVYGLAAVHTHAAGSSLDADDHGHDSGTPITGIYLDATSFNSDFVIGDDVSDAAGINATSVDLYLDFWNGAAWVNKHSILATGKTLDTDVDISDGGTYPDTYGLWSVRVVPNSASADLVIGSVNLKHNLDNN